MATTAEPTAEDLAAWQGGALTVRRAMAEFGLSRARLWSLMNDGTLRWYAEPGYRGTRHIARGDLVRYVAALYASQR